MSKATLIALVDVERDTPSLDWFLAWGVESHIDSTVPPF